MQNSITHNSSLLTTFSLAVCRLNALESLGLNCDITLRVCWALKRMLLTPAYLCICMFVTRRLAMPTRPRAPLVNLTEVMHQQASRLLRRPCEPRVTPAGKKTTPSPAGAVITLQGHYM